VATDEEIDHNSEPMEEVAVQVHISSILHSYLAKKYFSGWTLAYFSASWTLACIRMARN
jgi:hypothetical protein